MHTQWIALQGRNPGLRDSESFIVKSKHYPYLPRLLATQTSFKNRSEKKRKTTTSAQKTFRSARSLWTISFQMTFFKLPFVSNIEINYSFILWITISQDKTTLFALQFFFSVSSRKLILPPFFCCLLTYGYCHFTKYHYF